MFVQEDRVVRYGGLKLRLQYKPTPENAPKLARVVVRAARDIFGVELDYSPDSLVQVDGIIEEFKKEQAAIESIGETLFSLGCYLGEVMIRSSDAIWRNTIQTPLRNLVQAPVVIAFSEDNYCSPVDIAFRRFLYKKSDSLAEFYSSVVEEL